MLLFVARTMLLVLIYVFISVILFYIVKDLKRTGLDQQHVLDFVANSRSPQGIITPTGLSATNSEVGVLRVESAPPQYNILGVEIPLTDTINLGRDDGNDVVLPGGFVSGQHARIYLQNGQYWLEDRGSTNGTLLNNVPIKKSTVLASGDQIVIGDITLRFVRWGYEVG